MGVGHMRERLTLLTFAPAAIALVSLTQAAGVATATTSAPHGFSSKDYVTTSGADQAGYNGKVKIAVTSPTTFTYSVSSGLASPATGSIAAIYTSDAQGGRRTSWRTVDVVPAEEVPLRTSERLQLAAVQSSTVYRFRIRSRADVYTTMQLQWTPVWPPDSATRTLQVTGVLPDGDGRVYHLLEAAVVPSVSA